ncbi:MAG: hypothetical protein HY735_03540 [Verrucomicrobia bacterium]|nr:hypothetical protein [Verrucomicrobiota bacterium]
MTTLDKLLGFSPTVIAAYLTSAWCLGRALWHVFSRRCLTKQLALGKEALEQILADEAADRASALNCIAQVHVHPAIHTACRLAKGTSVPSDTFERWVNRDIGSALAPLVRACRANRGQAAVAGFAGTILGLLLGSLTFADSRSSVDMVAAVCMGLGTTLLGAIASEIEAGSLRALEKLESDLEFEGGELLDQFTKPRLNPPPTTPAAGEAPNNGSANSVEAADAAFQEYMHLSPALSPRAVECEAGELRGERDSG